MRLLYDEQARERKAARREGITALLLVDESGAHVRRERERFVVSTGAVDLAAIRAGEVDALTLCGRVEITSGALDLAMSRRIPVTFTTALGKYRGTLLPFADSGARLRSRQYAALADPAQRLALARTLVDAQLANQSALVRRMGLRRAEPVLTAILEDVRSLRSHAWRVRTVDELRGVEGAASRLVFTAVSCCVDPRLGFTHRAVRRGDDPLNVVLDILGGLLASASTSAVAASRLDPYEGALHGDARGAPALALDLADVYRPLLVTATAVTVFSKRIIQPRHAVVRPGQPCHLTTEGVSRVCSAFGRAIRREVRRPGRRAARSYLHHLASDAQAMASWFRATKDPYDPLTVK